MQNRSLKTDSKLVIETRPKAGKTLIGLLAPVFSVQVQAGVTLRTLLCEQLSIDSDYVDRRIQTVFLNGRPVDDIHTAIVPADAVVALSAAMPGLVGAMFRKGGVLRNMRGSISHTAERKDPPRRNALIDIKLFNLVLKELGPLFLTIGIWLRPTQIADFFEKRPALWTSAVAAFRLDAQSIGAADVPVLAQDNRLVWTTVRESA